MSTPYLRQARDNICAEINAIRVLYNTIYNTWGSDSDRYKTLVRLESELTAILRELRRIEIEKG